MIERVLPDVERALRAQRPDDAGRILREIEIWCSLSGRWHTARYDPGGPLSVPISPGTCVEAAQAAVRLAFPDRAGAITACVARALWPTGLRSQTGSFLEDYRRAEALVAEPDHFPSLAVLGPPESAREQLRITLELGPEPIELGLRPIFVPFRFRRASSGRVVVQPLGNHRLEVNGTSFKETPLSEGDVVSGGDGPRLLFLDQIAKRE